VLDETDVDPKQRAEFFRSEQFPLRAVGKDAAALHHDDAIDLRENVGDVVGDHQNADALLGDAAEGFTELALGCEVEGVGGLVEEQHVGLVDEGAGDHDAALFAGRHFADQFRFEMRGLHEQEGVVGALAHFRRDVEVGPKGGGRKESGNDGVETTGHGGALARQFGGDDAEVGAKLRDIPPLAAEEAQLGGGRDDGIALAGDGFDQRRFAAAVGAENGEVLAISDAQGDIVEDDIVATGDADVAHREEVGFAEGRGQEKIIAEARRRTRRWLMSSVSGVHLNLWKKRLGRVPPSVWENAEIETLVLADNDLAEAPEQLGRLHKLRMLDLGHNVLTGIPDSLGDLEGLTDFLYLHDNRLTALPATLGKLKRLRYLNIGENAFAKLPAAVCAMEGLVELRASDNRLTSLPECVGQLTRLRELHLRNNRLSTLPAWMGEMLELRQIDLRGNPLQSLPEAMATLPRLEKIDLRWVTTLTAPGWIGDLEARGCLVYW
jgi:hypothetical protein